MHFFGALNVMMTAVEDNTEVNHTSQSVTQRKKKWKRLIST